MGKPFQLELLKAKIEALLRRIYHYKEKNEIYLWGELHFDCTSQRRRNASGYVRRRLL